MSERQPLSEFFWPVTIYMEDTDAGGIVFYANYLKYMERARTECLRALGFDKRFIFTCDSMFVVHSLNVEYKAPAALDDELQVEAHILQLKRTAIVFRQNVWRGEELLCEAQVKIACVDKTRMRPCPIPDAIREKLKSTFID